MVTQTDIPGVVLDPGRNFGRPTVDEVGITTYILASQYWSNDRDAAKVAHWMEVEERHVMAAVQYEQLYGEATGEVTDEAAGEIYDEPEASDE